MRARRSATINWSIEATRLARATSMGPSEALGLIADFRDWKVRRTLGSALDAREPWIATPALRVLRALVHAGEMVVEWGAGGSTLYFLDSGCCVTTVEHSQDWQERVRADVSPETLCRWTPILIRPEDRTNEVPWDPSDWTTGATSESTDVSYYRYATAPAPSRDVTIVLIDGRARPTCLVYADAAFPNAVILLDQSERAHYQAAMSEVSRTRGRPRHYAGSVRGLNHLSRTSLWTARNGRKL